MDNPMASGPQAPVNPLEPLAADHDQAKAQFGKISGVTKLAEATRAELDKLVSLGDAVDQEDVMKGMAALVGAGGDPEALMATMANSQNPMPEGGAALAAWVQQQDAQVKQHEAQLSQMHAVAQHQLGVSALRLLAGHHIAGQVAQAVQPPVTAPGGANPMEA